MIFISSLSVKPLIKKSLLILTLTSFLINLYGQLDRLGIKFDNISIKKGLSQSSPNSIFQDSHGLVWIGTEDGLNKYDGYTFTVYKPEQNGQTGISNQRISVICEDSTGNLWIGTNGGGLNRYLRNSDNFQSFTENSGDELSVSGSEINCLLPVSDSELWIGTENGLSIMDIQTLQFMDPVADYPALSEISGTSVNALVIESSTYIWIGTNEGLLRLNTIEGTSTAFKNDILNPELLPGDIITALITDQYHNLWIGTDKGLAKEEIATGNIVKIDLKEDNTDISIETEIKCLLEDNEGNIWVGTMINGLYILSPESNDMLHFSYDYDNPYSIGNNDVLSIMMDFSGMIWLGTNGIDIYNPKKEKFTLYDYVPYTQEKLVFRNIHPIYEDEWGTLWVGSKTDGIHLLNRGLRTYRHLISNPDYPDGLPSNKIRAIKEYPEDIIWVGTEDMGITKIYLDENRNPYQYVKYQHNLNDSNCITSNKIYAFYVDEAGQLWIGTDNGLTIMNIDEETFRQYRPDPSDTNSINHTTVYSIYGDSNNNIWIATDNGINKYDPSTDGFIHYVHNENDTNSLINNELLCFHEDQLGQIWIGTYGGGIDKLDPITGDFTHYNRVDIFETAVIYGILEDETGSLWLSSNNGIIKFNPESGEAKQFKLEDGLQSNEYNGTSYYKSSSGEMFFGGQYGFNSFYPEEVIIDSTLPKIILADLQVHNVSVKPGEGSPLDKHISEATEIIFDHKQNNFTIYFSALHFANPELNQYKYKLEGFDKDWMDAGHKRFVTYTNLPYSKWYTFRVIASNSDGVWNNTGLSVRIRVKPPFWATIWFRIIAGAFILGLVFYLIRLRIMRTQNQKLLFEKKFKDSSQELDTVKKQLDEQHEEIVIQKRELKQREKDQENLMWFNQGLGIFSELISKNKDDLTKLCSVVIEKLVEYVDAQQGGIFLLNDDNEEDQFLELTAHYAFSDSKINSRFGIGEGYVGTCFNDKSFIEIDNLAPGYSALKSGLGQEDLKHLVLAPMMINEICIGVVELLSFRKLKGYRLSFIEKLLETFSSIINTERANIKLKTVLEYSNKQAEELKEHEEQLQMNLEELKATQEESARREDELIKLAEEAATREEMLTNEIDTLKQKYKEDTGKPYNEPSSEN